MSIPPTTYIVKNLTKCVGGGGRRDPTATPSLSKSERYVHSDNEQQGDDPYPHMSAHVEPDRRKPLLQGLCDTWTLYATEPSTVESFLCAQTNDFVLASLLTQSKRYRKLFFRKGNHWIFLPPEVHTPLYVPVGMCRHLYRRDGLCSHYSTDSSILQ